MKYSTWSFSSLTEFSTSLFQCWYKSSVILLVFILNIILSDITFPQLMYWHKLYTPSMEIMVTSASGNLFAGDSFNRELYKSTDNGDSWTIIFYDDIQALAAKGMDTLLFGTGEGKLYISPNGGINISILHTFPDAIRSIASYSVTETIIFLVGTSNGCIYISKDSGTTWVPHQLPTWEIREFDFVQNRIYSSSLGGLFYSDDYGESWNNMVIVQSPDKVWTFCNDNQNNIYASLSSPYGIYKSTDSGTSWSLCFDVSYETVLAMYYSQEGEIFAGQFMSTDYGLTWQQVFYGDVYSLGSKDTIAFVITFGNSLFRESSGITTGDFFPMEVGNKWQYLRDYSYHGSYTNHMYTIIEEEIIGDTIIDDKTYYIFITSLDTQYYRMGEDNKLYSFQDTSEILEMDFNLMEGQWFIYNNFGALVFEGYNYLFEKARFYKARKHSIEITHFRFFTDSIGCSKFYDYYSGPFGISEDILRTVVNALIIRNDSINYYSDYVKPEIVFSPITQTDTLVVNLSFLVKHEYTKFSGSGTSRNFIKNIWIKSFYSKDDSLLYDSLLVPVNPNSNSCLARLKLDSLLFAGYKFNYAIYASDKSLIPEISRSPEEGYYQLVYNPVGVDDEKGNILSFSLSQNYPNPFNSSTEIIYQLSDQSHVILKVYDILGREITTLVDEEKPAGMFEIEFNGASLPSGVYIYKLQAGEFTDTKKLILMK